MKTIEAEIASDIERLRMESGSDFAGLGLVDTDIRKLRWFYATGSISARTLQVEQKPTAGLSGAAIRSGRPASTSYVMSDADRFKLGEPVMLAEQLRIAAALPLETAKGISGVILIGRHSGQCYRTDELECACQIAKGLAKALLT